MFIAFVGSTSRAGICVACLKLTTLGRRIVNRLYHMDWKSSMQCYPYFGKYFETPCTKSVMFQQTDSAILQSYWNFPYGLSNYIQACIFSRLKLLFHFYVKRTIHRQDFGAKFNLTYHNGAPVADIFNCKHVCTTII